MGEMMLHLDINRSYQCIQFCFIWTVNSSFSSNVFCIWEAHAELERREKRVSKTLVDLESEIARLETTLTEERESHARTCFSKDDMMSSLVENQKLLSSQQSTIEQQVSKFLFLLTFGIEFMVYWLFIVLRWKSLPGN